MDWTRCFWLNQLVQSIKQLMRRTLSLNCVGGEYDLGKVDSYLFVRLLSPTHDMAPAKPKGPRLRLLSRLREGISLFDSKNADSEPRGTDGRTKSIRDELRRCQTDVHCALKRTDFARYCCPITSCPTFGAPEAHGPLPMPDKAETLLARTLPGHFCYHSPNESGKSITARRSARYRLFLTLLWR